MRRYHVGRMYFSSMPGDFRYTAFVYVSIAQCVGCHCLRTRLVIMSRESRPSCEVSDRLLRLSPIIIFSAAPAPSGRHNALPRGSFQD